MKRDERQPKWILNSVWSTYLQCKEYFAWAESNNAWIESDDVLIPSRQDLEIFQKLVFDETCEHVWDIVPSRVNDPSLTEVDERRTAPFQFFLSTLRQALAGPTASSLMPAKERRDRGEKIAKLARQLGKELKFIAGKGDVPVDLIGPLAMYLESALEAYADQEINMDELAMTEYDEGPQLISLVARDLFFRGDESIFGALAKCAESWANTTPDEYRTDDTKAKRNFFAREMTRYFNVHFGQPHRDMVARLTVCLLHQEMTALDVTRNAPVNRPGSAT